MKTAKPLPYFCFIFSIVLIIPLLFALVHSVHMHLSLKESKKVAGSASQEAANSDMDILKLMGGEDFMDQMQSAAGEPMKWQMDLEMKKVYLEKEIAMWKERVFGNELPLRKKDIELEKEIQLTGKLTTVSPGEELIHKMQIARRLLVELEMEKAKVEKEMALLKDVELEKETKMEMIEKMTTDVKRAQRKNVLKPGCYRDDNGEIRCTSTYPNY